MVWTRLLTIVETAHAQQRWTEYMGSTPLSMLPLFDGRAITYPDVRTVRDYLSWRQVDTHINNQVCAEHHFA
jgi:tRNA(His) guanylyltransferase